MYKQFAEHGSGRILDINQFREDIYARYYSAHAGSFVDENVADYAVYEAQNEGSHYYSDRPEVAVELHNLGQVY